MQRTMCDGWSCEVLPELLFSIIVPQMCPIFLGYYDGTRLMRRTWWCVNFAFDVWICVSNPFRTVKEIFSTNGNFLNQARVWCQDAVESSEYIAVVLGASPVGGICLHCNQRYSFQDSYHNASNCTGDQNNWGTFRCLTAS